MKKIFLTSIVLFFLGIFLSFSQDKISKLDVRFGIGTSQWSDLYFPEISTIAIAIENEINYKFSKYFAISGSLNYSFGIPKRIEYGFEQSKNLYENIAGFFQISSIIFYSPFKNNKKNDFRVGVGPVWINANIYEHFEDYLCSTCIPVQSPIRTNIRKANTLAANFIIEDSYTIKEQFIVGLKLYYQPNLSGLNGFNENIGLTAKFGIKIFNKQK